MAIRIGIELSKLCGLLQLAKNVKNVLRLMDQEGIRMSRGELGGHLAHKARRAHLTLSL